MGLNYFSVVHQKKELFHDVVYDAECHPQPEKTLKR